MRSGSRNTFVLICAFLLQLGNARSLHDCSAEADVLLLLDVSGSIRDDTTQTWLSFTTFINALVNCLPIGREKMRIAAVQFSTVASLEFDFDATATSLESRRAIDVNTFPGIGDGRTNLADSLSLAIDTFRGQENVRPDVPRIVVAITDGKTNMKSNETGERIGELSRIAHVIAIGISDSQNRSQLSQLASSSLDVFHNVTYRSLTAAASRIYDVLCGSVPKARAKRGTDSVSDNSEAFTANLESLTDNPDSLTDNPEAFDSVVVMAGCGDANCPENRMSQLYLALSLFEQLLDRAQANVSLVTPDGIGFVLGYFTKAEQIAQYLDLLHDFSSELDLVKMMEYVEAILETSFKPKDKRIVYFITDGCSENRDIDLLAKSIELGSKARVVPIGITDIANVKVLKLLSGCPELVVEKMDIRTGASLVHRMGSRVCTGAALDTEKRQGIISAGSDDGDKRYFYFLLLTIALLVTMTTGFLFCYCLFCPKEQMAKKLDSNEKMDEDEIKD